jgi:hypothetical protein
MKKKEEKSTTDKIIALEVGLAHDQLLFYYVEAKKSNPY